MYNKELFNKICNVNCPFAELEEFCATIDKKEFDLETPFEKYYSVDTLILAIKKYQSKGIDAKYLAHWMNAYNWLIMGGFKIKYKDESVSLKEFLIWRISDWIDSLSFFDDSDDWYNLEEYKTAFKVLDKVLQELDHCRAVFAKDDENYNYNDVVVLITNDTDKYFVKLYGELDYDNDKIDFEKVEYSYLDSQAAQLYNSGYQELIYFNWENEED